MAYKLFNKDLLENPRGKYFRNQRTEKVDGHCCPLFNNTTDDTS